MIKGKYGYSVYKRDKIALHMVVYESSIGTGICVFNNSKDAVKFITNLKSEMLSLFNIEMKYDYNMDACSFCDTNWLELYQSMTVLYSRLDNHQIYGI